MTNNIDNDDDENRGSSLIQCESIAKEHYLHSALEKSAYLHISNTDKKAAPLSILNYF